MTALPTVRVSTVIVSAPAPVLTARLPRVDLSRLTVSCAAARRDQQAAGDGDRRCRTDRHGVSARRAPRC